MLGDSLARIAALLGDAARARIVLALFDDIEARASDLAQRANVSAQTASFHLSKLCDAGLLTGARRGRWRVYSLAGPDVAAAIEALMALAPANGAPRNQAPKSIELARTCYDHLAGRLGVSLADALTQHGWLEVAENQFVVTRQGEANLRTFGIDVAELRTLKRQFAKRCLDWTERRYHVAGSLGAAIVAQFKRRKWVVPLKGSRVLHVTSDGYRGLRRSFGVVL